MSQLSAITCHKNGLTSQNSFEVMNGRAILQLSLIALCVISTPLNRKITEMAVRVCLHLKPYLDNLLMNIIPVFSY